MRGLIKQLRISVLVVLGVSIVDLVTSVVENLRSGKLLATLGDWALTTVLFCALVAVIHSAIYGAVHIGRPEGREARGVRAGLLVLLLIDLSIVWPLLSAATGKSALYAATCVVVAALPLLTCAVAWAWSRLRGEGADIARNSALLFGVLALLPQLPAAVALLVAA
ncbi:hypothetical protein [Streptomyces cylindrosporus]|uniref:Uncharacterized protein n=1 Tax=Streptomyces cylindrosporus TaxID=2927583 RepID=A0ABS9YHA1_9ACTN|nr:hypothetical protein [Streptomyces cylindrosporus]MCI3275951.1 hypothetical protein [Streptomyces cylindrosporus]